MKKVFYEKVGRRYLPVHEYDSFLVDALPKGSHLLMVHPGGKSTLYNVDPAYAPLIAAGRVAEQKMVEAIYKATEMRPKTNPVTEGQKQAWDKLAKEFGTDLYTLQTDSCRAIAEAGIKALQDEAFKILQNPSAKLAYEQFLLVAELTKEREISDA